MRLAAITAVVTVFLVTSSPAQQAPAARSHLAKHDRARLAGFVSERRSTASVLIAYHPLHGDTLAEQLGALGGRIQYRADSVGYLRVDVPIARVLEASALPGIDAINLNGTQVYGASGGVVANDSTGWRVAPPDASTPPENPYLPMRDVGAPQFVAEHPTFDGRGVTVGVLECCADFRHPVFEEPALGLDGTPTRKLAAVYTVVAADSEATNRVHARAWVQAAHGRLVYDGVSYRAPRDGRFRIGYYTGPVGFKAMLDVSKDTLLVPRHRRAVLLDPGSGEVWVDVLNDHAFMDAPVLHDYNTTGEVGAFGRDQPTTSWDDRLTFAVGVDTATAIIDVYPGDNGHVNGVAGIVAGTHFYGSRATGAAPHARVVQVWASQSWKGMEAHQSSRIEGLILLARHPDVDVITLQEWYDLRLKDGTSVWSVVADRVVKLYRKAIFQGAGNDGPGLGTGYEATNGAYVMKVGGSIHRDTWLASFALLADHDDYVFNESSRGPYSDGRIGPDFLAPMVQVLAEPLGESGDTLVRNNTGLFSGELIYRTPPGYTMQFGTSYATPTAAGVAALLISAARQTGTQVDPMRLHAALSGGARFLPRYQAYEQGAGLLDTRAAWARLRGGTTPVDIEVDAPARTILSPYLRSPGRGRGLYEREGWKAGDSAIREVRLTRTSGPAEPMHYELRWLGNDGTFESADTISLGLNLAATLTIVVHPRSAGAHSALLQLLGPEGRVPAQQVPATIIAAEPLDSVGHFTFQTHGQAKWLEKTSYFVAVPPVATALNLALAIEHGPLAFTVIDPTGNRFPSASPALTGHHYGWPKDIAVGTTRQERRGTIRRIIEFPEPGVWEIAIQFDAAAGSTTRGLRGIRQTPAAFTFTASLTRLDVDAARMRQTGAASSLLLTLHNTGAALKARFPSGSLASVRRERLSLEQGGAPIVREYQIDSGTTRFAVQLSHSSDSGADIDVHVYDCTSGHCDRHVSAVFQGANKELRVRKPHPGRWRVVIDPYEIPSAGITIDYRDELVHPKYGSVAVQPSGLTLAAGDTATVVLAVRRGVPERGRSLAVRLEAQDTVAQAPSGPPPWGDHYPPGTFAVVRADLDDIKGK